MLPIVSNGFATSIYSVFIQHIFLAPAMMAMQAAPKCVVEHPKSDPSGEIGEGGSDDDVPSLEPLEDGEDDMYEEEDSDETYEDEGAESEEQENSEDKELSEEEHAPKTPENHPREWNELFFQTPRFGNSGPHNEEIREFCIALMQFWARHHPEILKTLVVYYY